MSRRKLSEANRIKRLKEEWRYVKYYLDHKDDKGFSIYNMEGLFSRSGGRGKDWIARVTIKWGVREKDLSKCNNRKDRRHKYDIGLWWILSKRWDNTLRIEDKVNEQHRSK